MKERPILFSAPMVRALLDGSKTQTRRVVKPQPPEWAAEYWGEVGTYSGLSEPIHYWQGAHPEYEEEDELLWPSKDKWSDEPQWDRFEGTGLVSPYGSEENCIKQAGQLWVREAWRARREFDSVKPSDLEGPVDGILGTPIIYEASRHESVQFGKLRPSMFMPRWASRITLEITGVRVERLQDISEADAKAEGCKVRDIIYPDEPRSSYSYADQYRILWESINGPDTWDSNPWVWVVEFKRIFL